MGLTTQTWYDERIPLEGDDYRHRKAPRESSIVPHAVASLEPALMTDLWENLVLAQYLEGHPHRTSSIDIARIPDCRFGFR